MTAQTIDVAAVLGSLKDFQRHTAEWVFHRLFTAPDASTRFLVADEVGLGKTHVAKGVMAQAIDHLQRTGHERQDIVYVCSNGAIARQNLKKLAPPGIEPLERVERLTMLPIADLSLDGGLGNTVNLLAITPGTSLAFGRDTGRFQERALAYSFLRAVWGAGDFPARARWIFWEGLRGNGPSRLEDQWRQYRDRITPQVQLFKEELERLDNGHRKHRHPTIREQFDHLVEELAWKREFPSELKPAKAQFIGELRRVLATMGIRMLQPDLVVLDEFQRFKDLLDPDPKDWASALAHQLFTNVNESTGLQTRTLLLSATPYRMYTIADEGAADHYADFLETCRFLFEDDHTVEGLQRKLRRLRDCLTSSDIAEAASACTAIEDDLRRVMVRTERLAATSDRSGMLSEQDSVAPVAPEDLRAYLRLGALAEAVEHHDPSEYWKSSPYLFNFMEQYKLKQALTLAFENGALPDGDDLGPGPGLLSWAEVEDYQEVDPQNGRLRWLLDDLHRHRAFELLWVPPSLRYYDTGSVYESEGARAFTKRLVFSGWAVVPKVVSSLVSYEAERQVFSERTHHYSAEYSARGGQRLEFKVRPSDGTPAAMTAFLLVWPSPTLAALGDPRPVAQAGSPIDVGQLLAGVQEKVEAHLAELDHDDPPDGPVDQRWYWAAPLWLDTVNHFRSIGDWFAHEEVEQSWTGGTTSDGFDRHISEAWEFLMDHIELGRQPADLADVLARVAVGGPATCALRAVAATAGLDPTSDTALSAAARIAWSLRSFFNTPNTTALVVKSHPSEAGSTGGPVPFWQQVIDHCIAGNLQAVLDEHIHVLRDWLGYVTLDDDHREDAAGAISERLATALDLRSVAFRVDVPNDSPTGDRIGRHSMRSRFAVALGNQRLEEGGEARIESVSAAFNSPFWPFVLTSTSVGQEGLDFHLWSHAVVHWNLPANPVDLEQREGRVHRYKSHAVRRNIAATIGVPDGWDGDIWAALFETAAATRGDDDSEMVPYWVFNEGPARILRLVPVPPFSREAAALPRLRKSLAAYRLAFGQPRQEELLELLGRDKTDDELLALASTFRIDLSPPQTTTTQHT